MKKIAVGIIAVFSLVLLQPVHAEPNKSIVIIDTAIDSSIPQLKAKLVQEVCILGSMVCPNGQRFQEGPGAATLPSAQALKGGFEHGTIMALIANQVNPDANIIFVRIAGLTKRGTMDTYSINEVTKALTWVVNNKQKYNIVSVSASQGSHSGLRTGTEYCPIRATHAELIGNIEKLSTSGVATIFSAGNNRDYSRIDFPACIPQAVAVGGATEDDAMAPYSNAAPEVDFYYLGAFNTQVGRSVGTSASAAAFSANWAKNYKGTYQTTYDYFVSVSKQAVGRSTTTNRLVSLLG
jgi:hypothetical protein